jgi:2,3-bisphosphoglycerate-independent phosphoglycerate mutase
MSKKVALIIMDGWGNGLAADRSAIAQAQVPFIDSLDHKYPHTQLITYGEQVGLPEGQMGNSEVGHLNIGAGRVVYQELLRINIAIREGTLARNATLLETIAYCKVNHKPLHLLGLVSDGGVHAHTSHLRALCDIAKANGLTNEQIFIHAMTDGRDTDPRSGLGYISDLTTYLTTNKCGRIATVCGRYYGMDRDHRWERVQLAYNLLVHGQGTATTDLLESIRASYAAGVTDEFILPLVHTDATGTPLAKIQAGDGVIAFNFRTDRCREITQALTQLQNPAPGMQPLPLHYTTMTMYDHALVGITPIFHKDDLNDTLGEVLARHGKTQLRAAETEKYPHVTFFFNGGRETPFEGEQRIMQPSPKVATYDLQPEMSAQPLAAAVVACMTSEQPDFICLNFANPDMVGHTGVFEAVVRACETINDCVGQVVQTALALDYTILLTADHGNADYMINDDGSPNTAHTMNLVPLWMIDRSYHPTLRAGKLADIAPTVLQLMGIQPPSTMTGTSLIASSK